MSTTPAPVLSAGLHLPALAGRLIALYLDRCADGFRPWGVWRDEWRGPFGMVRTWGLDVGGVRLRVVSEPVAAR